MNEAVWIIGLCAMWSGALLLFRRHRKTTRSYANWNAYKANLPAWIKLFDLVTLLIIFVPLAIVVVMLLSKLSAMVHPDHLTGGAAKGIIVFSSFLAALAPAALIANGISWLIPPLRRTNLSVMSAADGVSFRSANRGLLLFALVVTTLALAQGVLAAFEPWSR